MSTFFEALMVISFGLSWPLSIIKSYRSRSTKGKSIFFLFFIFFGYICGVIAKITADNFTYVFYLYILNLLMVGTDIILYFRNLKLQKNEK